ncbi:MAG TPA: transcriptional regulator [Anaerolineaceae bacterium]|jgi:DNA-binding transcriptional ArsR family regulator|nr:transcriptional regulator [Anaerolineaceae bacterium]
MMNELVMEKIDPELLADEVIMTMADSFKALGDPTRLRIMALLFNGERTVGDLADHLSVSQSAVSHQLRLLRNLDIVRHRKDGREVYYALADDHIRDIYTRTLEHILID